MGNVLMNLAGLLGDSAPSMAMKKRFLAMAGAEGSMLLMDALRARGFFVERIGELLGELGALKGTEFAPAPLITGDDLTAAGMMPGPGFKRILERVYDAQLEGRIGTREEALALAREGAV
jgi:hypothetical protein